MDTGLKIALSLGCGVLIGLAAGLNLNRSDSGSAELKAEISALSRGLAQLDARLASGSATADPELILEAVRTALAERGEPATPKRGESAPTSDAWTAAESEQIRSAMEHGADPQDMLPLARKAMRSLNK